jgi:hypothetical protein
VSATSQYNKPKPFEWVLVALAFLASGIVSGCLVELTTGERELPQVVAAGLLWIPGFVFGLVFGAVVLREQSSVLAFASLAAIANLVSLQTAGALFLGVLEDSMMAKHLPDIPVPRSFGFAADVGINMIVYSSLPGTVLLTRLASLFTDRERRLIHDVLDAIVGVVVGALAGYLYAASNMLPQTVCTVGAFAIWHLGVGLLTVARVTSLPMRRQAASFEVKVVRFLKGPIVQLIGLLGVVYSLIDAVSNQ